MATVLALFRRNNRPCQGTTPVIKLNTLRRLLDGSEKRAIDGLESTNANYKEAVEFLKERYGKKTMIQRAEINEIMNLTAAKDSDDVNSLRKFRDLIEIHYRGLQALFVEENT